MPNEYETGVWYGWNGGKCPVHPKSIVKIVTDRGAQCARTAETLDWNCGHSPIRAFGVVEPYVPPLEVWIPVYPGGCLGGNYDSEEQAERATNGLPGISISLFREVKKGGDT